MLVWYKITLFSHSVTSYPKSLQGNSTFNSPHFGRTLTRERYEPQANIEYSTGTITISYGNMMSFGNPLRGA